MDYFMHHMVITRSCIEVVLVGIWPPSPINIILLDSISREVFCMIIAYTKLICSSMIVQIIGMVHITPKLISTVDISHKI